MNSGIILPNRLTQAVFASRLLLVAALFFSFSVAQAAESMLPDNHSGNAIGNTGCEVAETVDPCVEEAEAIAEPPIYFINPGSGKKVEFYYRGLKNLLPARELIPSAETIENVYVEVVYKGKLPTTSLHRAIQATLQGGRVVQLQPKLISGSWGSSGVAVFSAEVGKTDRVSLDFEVEESSAQSMLLYVLRNGADQGIYQAGTYASHYGYKDTKEFKIPLPNDVRTRDIVVTLPISEITTDGKTLEFIVSAGNRTNRFSRKWDTNFDFDNECCIDSVQTILRGVTGNADHVSVTVISPSTNGQSYVLSGLLTASVCPVCAPLDVKLPETVCTDASVVFECPNPGAGYTATWDFGEGAMPRTYTGFGTIHVMFENAQRQKITIDVVGPDCVSRETHYVDVMACNGSTCALEGALVIQQPAHGNADGVIELDMCVTCGSTPPYKVFYTVWGQEVEKGPFSQNKPRLTGLEAGTYSNIYVVDANGCRTNVTGPVTLCNGGCGQVNTCPEAVCTLSGYLENNAKRALWIPNIGFNDPRWRWETGTAEFIAYEDKTAKIIGRVVSIENPSCGFEVEMVFRNRRNWAEWSALGRDWKGNRSRITDNQHTTWDYYEMVPDVSTLKGFGCWTGTLKLSPKPADYYYGLQVGEAANDHNLNPGLSAWFSYSGTLNGTNYTGEGDINDEGTCRYQDLQRNAVPIIACAPDFAVTCGGTPDDAPKPSINCGNPDDYTLTFVDREVSTNPRKIERTWTVAGPGGPASCKQFITFGDNVPPVFTKVPTETKMSCRDVREQTAEATDDCGQVTISVRETKFNEQCIGTYDLRRVWTATDESGNTSTVELIINVVDEKGPEFSAAPRDIVIECKEDLPTDRPAAIDDCGGNVSIDYQVTSCEAATPIYTWSGGELTFLTEGPNPGLTYNSSMSALKLNGVCSDLPSQRLRWKITNQNNFTVYVKRIVAGSQAAYGGIEVPANSDIFFFTSTAAGQSAKIFWDNASGQEQEISTASVADQCDLSAAETCTCVYTREWTAKDECGNRSVYRQKVWQRDTKAPTLRNIPADRTYSTAGQIPAPSGVTATDACTNASVDMNEVKVPSAEYGCDEAAIHFLYGAKGVNLPLLRLNGQQYLIGKNPLTIKENCDGTALVTGIVHNAAEPNASFEIYLKLTGRRSFAQHTAAGNNPTTNCGTADKNSWRFYTVDQAGSRATGLGSNQGIVLQFSAATGSEWLQLGEGANKDNCKLGIWGQLNYQPTAGNFAGNIGKLFGSYISVDFDQTDDCDNSFTLIRVWSATDECGNRAIERQVIRVTDEEAPTFVNVVANLSIECSDQVPNSTITAQDNADNDVEVTLDERTAGDACAKTITRTWTAKDDCGNTKTARQVITIEDKTGPTIVFSNPQINALNSGDLFVISCSDIPTIDESIASLSDNCDPNPTVRFTDELVGQGNCAADGFSQRFRCTWVAKDQCGNETVFFLIVEIHDEEAPTFTQIPSAVTQGCDQQLPTSAPVAADNCSSAPEVVETQQIITGSCANSYQVIRLWTATDNCGNTATATQVVTITDDIKPELSDIPQAVTISCEDQLPIEIPRATDNCDAEVRLVETSETRIESCENSYSIIRTWVATDNCGNSTSASQLITIQDLEKPTLSFSNSQLQGFTNGQELVVECSNIPVFNEGDVIASDNCDPNVDVQYNQQILEEGDCATNGFVRILSCNWTATDNCGNRESISITLKVRDNTSPTIASVPGSITISCDQSLPNSQPVISDNCTAASALSIEETSTIERGSCTDNYQVIRLWTVTDRCGNVATASQTITVSDLIKPRLAQIPESISISCEQDMPTSMPTATDNCDSEVSVTVEATNQPNGCPGSYSVVRVFTATDNCGNTATASQVVTVRDLTPPVFAQLPTALTISCDEAVPTSTPIATDNCDNNVTVVETSSTQPGNCPDNYTIIRMWTATDHCGNTATASQVVTVKDEVAPVLVSLPQNLTIRCDEQLPTNRPSATDNCDQDVSVSETQEIIRGTCENSFIVIRRFTATDNCGNTSTGTQEVTVIDDTAPVFANVPENITLNCDQQIPGNQPNATDNCDGQVAVTETQETRPGTCTNGYEIVRIFSATDKCGNASTTSQVVTIQDIEAPVFVFVPANLSLSCSASIPTEEAQVTDNCDTQVSIIETQETRPGTCAGTFDVIRLFTATDACGNVSTASQVVSVFDNEKPSFTNIPANTSISCDAALPTTEPAVSDNCDTNVSVVLSEDREDGSCDDNYRIIRRWTATDHCGNVATASQVVIIQDLTNPTLINIPEDITLSCADNLPTDIPSATDNCDTDVTITENQLTQAGSCENSYRVIRIWTATDNCGNTSTAQQVVTLEDREAPVFANIPQAITISCDAPLPSIGPNVSDNCDPNVNINETQQTNPGSCANTFEVVRTWTATDACGNVATASQVVTVQDITAPTFEFVPTTVTIDCDASLPADQPEVSDNCDQTVTVVETQQTETGSCAGAYTVIRVWTATDNCGNVATASQIVNVQDITPPTFASVPQATIISCDAPLPVSQPIVNDNCDSQVTVIETQRNEPGSCPGTYVIYRVWTATDDCNNTSTAEQKVDIQDITAPVFTQVPPAISLSCEDAVPTTPASASDNCDANVSITETQDRQPGNCPGSYVVVRTFLATDHCGNTTSASQIVTFEDNTAPVFANVPTAISIACNSTLPSDAPTATDICDANVTVQETQLIQPGTCTDNYLVIRTWTASDNCGNVATTSQVVTVEDKTTPTFVNVPLEVTVQCSEPLPTDLAIATDNCDTDVQVSVSERTQPGSCLDSYTVYRVFTATDNCGNTATAEQKVNVVDTEAPSFAFIPEPVIISCSAAIPNTMATATDNCDSQVTVTEQAITTPGNCLDSYTLTRVFTATDNCGNTATASQVITIEDTEAPSFTNVPQAITIRCDEPLPTTAPTASDNCDSQVVITETQRNEPGACEESYTVIRVWTATDNCGKTATAEQRVTLTDQVAPVFASVPTGVIISCDQAVPTDMPVANDNCDSNVSITENQTTAPGDCPGSYNIIRTFTATDGCGNTATASQLVQVEDTSNPVFADVPTAITISCDEALPTDKPTASDNCDSAVVIAENQDFLPGTCAGSYRVIRIWTATDNCGNSSTATQLVTVEDTTEPIFANVPQDLRLGCDEPIPTTLPTATDNCDSDVHVAETQQLLPGGCADSYTLVRTFTATDECGNSATATQAITVEDAGSPVFIDVPTTVDISCDEPLPTDMPTATDLCDGDVTITEIQTTQPGACPGAYSVIRTWTATDNCGNTTTATQLVTVGDRAEPTFTNVPANVTIICDADIPTDQPIAIDNCDPNVEIQESSDRQTGPCADSYTIFRIWTATDDCGNVATTSQRVTIEDSTSPVFLSVPPAITISCDQDLPTTQPVASDNCDRDVTITERTDRDRGNCENSYTITRIWTATDNCGNKATASQVVTIKDTTPPVFASIPPSITLNCDEAFPDNEPTATDNCDDEVRVRFTEQRNDGPCADSYELLRTWIAEDNCGNTASATQVITVIDPVSPVFAQVPPDVTITCDRSLPTTQPIATDNCDNSVSISETTETLPGACPDSYEVIRTWIITDNCGNTNRATQKVTIIDSGKPVFTRVPASRTINCDEDPGDEEPIAQDDCDTDVAITMTEMTTGDDCTLGIQLLRIWTATDNCGNTASASQTITFKDSKSPVFGPMDRTLTVECDQPVPLIIPTATDNCDRELDIMHFDNREDKPCGATITRTWVASDDCGNTVSATQLIIIRDTQLPILSGVPPSVQINCDEMPPVATVTATDNCTNNIEVQLEEFELPGACPGEKTITRVWTAEDACGNQAVGSQVITITDGGVPTFVNVPVQVTISCDDPIPTDLPTATDNCSTSTNVSITVDERRENGNCADSYRLIRIFTATDNCGNTSTATQVVNILDTKPPVFASVPQATTISCGEAIPDSEATATDNCDIDVTVSERQQTIAGNCDDAYEILRIWTATDNCGNTASASQVITVLDNEKPVFTSVPANTSVNCGEVIPSEDPVVSDNCDSTPAVSMIETRVDGNSSNEYSLIRTWTASDNCGNTATASQEIRVIANGAPVFTFVPENITIGCGDAIPNADASAADNCDGMVAVIMSESRVNGNCANSYQIIRTWTATDSDGNSATARQTIAVSDNEPPRFSAIPSDTRLSCGDQTPSDLPSATDNCDTNVDISVTETRRNGQCASEYIIVRTFKATDACGNATTAEQLVTFADDQAPEFTFVPDSEEFQCSIGQPRQQAKAKDNCSDNVRITYEDVSPSADCSQRLQRIWIATDDCGNSSTAVQQILLEDNEKPELINVPQNTSVDLSAGQSIPQPANVRANDNCDRNPNVRMDEQSEPASGCGYTLIRTWTATDQCGNTARATQRISVIDNRGVGIRIDTNDDCAPSGIQLHAVPTTSGARYAWTASGGAFDIPTSANPIFIPAGPGNYSITLTVSGTACSGTTTETLTIEGATLTISGATNVCTGESISLSASTGADAYAWSGPNGFSSTQATFTIPNATVAQSGVYTLNATFGACTQQELITVTVSNTLNLGLQIPDEICAGNALTLTANNATSATWTTPDGQQLTGSSVVLPSVNFADHDGNWSVTASNSSGCSATESFSLKVNRQPVVSASNNSPICSGSTLDLVATGASTYQWTGPNGFTSTEVAPSISDLSSYPAGSYIFTVIGTNLSGCKDTTTTTVVINNGNSALTLSVPAVVCQGENVSFTATGASSYTWSGPNNFVSLEANPVLADISFAASGTYTLIADFGNGCTSSKSFGLIVSSELVTNAVVTNRTCTAGGSIALNLPVNQQVFSVDWADLAGANDPADRSGLQPGSYTASVSTGSCTKTYTYTIADECTTDECSLVTQGEIVVENPACGLPTGKIAYPGDPSGFTWVWTPNVSTGNEALGLSAGNYSLTVTKLADPNCTKTYVFNLADESTSQGSITAQDVSASCGQVAIASVQTAVGASFVQPERTRIVTLNGNGVDANNLPAGTHIAILTDGNGCDVAQDTFEVSFGGSLEVNVDIQAMECTADGVITIQPATPGSYVVDWSDLSQPTTDLTRNDLAAGDYTFTISDADGCSLTQNVTVPNNCQCSARNSIIRAVALDVCLSNNEANIGIVTVTQPVVPQNFKTTYLLVKVANSKVLEQGATGSFTVSGSDSYSIHQLIIDSTNFAPSNYATGKTVSEIEAMLIQGGGAVCGALTTFGARITTSECCINPEISSVTTTDANCGAQNGVANIQVIGNPSDYTYTWTPNLGSQLGQTNNIRGSLPSGTYSIRIVNRSDASCFGIATAVVGVSDIDAGLPIITNAACGENNGVVSFSGADPSLNFVWDDGGTGPVRNDLAAGTYVVTITTPQGNCEEVVTVEVGSTANLGLAAQINQEADCGQATGSVTLSASSATGAVSYDWGGGATRTDLSAGTYTVIATDQRGCVDSITFTLNERVAGGAQIAIQDVNLLCNGVMNGTPQFTIDYADDFRFPPQISFVDGNGEQATFGEMGPGNYCMVIRDADNCIAGSACFTVREPAALTVNVTALPAGCDDDGRISLDINGGTPPYRFDWAHLPAASDPRDISGLGQGQYTVFITDANGCVSTVNNVSISSTCGCAPTLPVVQAFPGDICLADTQVFVGTQVISSSTDPTLTTAYLLVDAAGIIQQVSSSPEFWINQLGSYTINGIIYDAFGFSTNSISLGTTSLASLNSTFTQGGGFICAGLDLIGTPINVTSCPGCNVEIGLISTNSPTIWCTDDGLPSVIDIRVSSSNGTLTYVIVDTDGRVIDLSSSNLVDIEGLPAGEYSIYVVATLTSSTVPQLGDLFFPRSGCIDISQPTVVTALTGADCNDPCQVSAGSINAIQPNVVCVDNHPQSISILAGGITGSQQAYLVVSTTNKILLIQDADGSLDLAALAAGQYRIYTLAYEQPLTGLQITASIDNLEGCFDLSAPAILTVTSGSACGQVTTADTVRVAIPVASADTACFVLDAGFNPTTTTYTLAGAPGSVGTSAFGDWSLLPNGCVVYTAGSTAGIDVDIITVIASNGGLSDTTVFIISVINAQQTSETVNINVGAGSTQTACPQAIPANFTSTVISLTSGGLSGSSTFGSYIVSASQGCLSYTAGNTSGFGVDTVRVLICETNVNLCHEVTYVISVLPQGDSIIRDVAQGDTLILCPPVGLLFGTAQTPTLCTQPTEGTVLFDQVSGCFIYTAPTGFSGTDELCIEVCDDQNICIQRNVTINVLPSCGDIVTDAVVVVDVANCDSLGSYCLPIAQSQIGLYALSLDGQPYRNTTEACNNGQGTQIFADTGSHVLVLREISTGCLDTVVIKVGCADCGFSLTPPILSVSACDETEFIVINLLQANWAQYSFTLDGRDARAMLQASGTRTRIAVDTGYHRLIIRALNNSCQEVIDVQVVCSTTASLTINRIIGISFTDTICIADLNLPIVDELISVTDICPGTLNGGEISIAFDPDSQCLFYTGLQVGVDSLCLEICSAEDCQGVTLLVEVLPTDPSFETVEVEVGDVGQFCIDTTALASPITEVFNFCEDNSGTAVEFILDETTFCVTYVGVEEGSEQGCFVICNAIACDTVFLTVNVVSIGNNLPPVAVNDMESTTKGMSVDINVIRNDTLRGPLVQMTPITLPANGNLMVLSDSLIRYTPNENFCGGIDSFTYVISNGFGFDTATVRIEVTCDELVIFSGFSPNGDGVNDFFRILGIEGFPDNRVIIFNRWGNEVYNRRGYSNDPDQAFNGRWDGKTLVDGTYFYVIDLGGNNGCRSGYLQIQR